MLNEVEILFIEFMSHRLNKNVEYVRGVYEKTKNEFKFDSSEFKDLTIKIYDLNKLLHDEQTEEELIATYKYHELMSAYRFLSYTFTPQEDRSGAQKLNTAFKLMADGQFRIFFKMLASKFFADGPREANVEEPRSLSKLAEYLVGSAKIPVLQIVDYGCGPGFLSFEIAKKIKNLGGDPTVILVDIDCLMKDFAQFRLQREGINVETISITEANLYPSLPKHELCIATEVMEHIKNPVKAFTNINAGLQPGGVLHGNYEDHPAHMLHVSPDLKLLRSALTANKFERISKFTYIKS